MEKYELTVVLPGKATAAKKKAFEELLKKLLTVFEGKISTSKDWGEMDLTFKIKRQKVGSYLHFEIEMPTSSVKPFSEKLKNEESIIRHLLIRN